MAIGSGVCPIGNAIGIPASAAVFFKSIYGKLQGQIELPFMIRVWEGRGKWCEYGDL